MTALFLFTSQKNLERFVKHYYLHFLACQIHFFLLLLLSLGFLPQKPFCRNSFYRGQLWTNAVVMPLLLSYWPCQQQSPTEWLVSLEKWSFLDSGNMAFSSRFPPSSLAFCQSPLLTLLFHSISKCESILGVGPGPPFLLSVFVPVISWSSKQIFMWLLHVTQGFVISEA